MNRPVAFFVCCLLGLALPRAALAEAISVKEFNQKLNEWKNDQKPLPVFPITVEGRITLSSKERLRLMNCGVYFTSKSEIRELARKYVEVTGKVVVDPRTGEFSVDISNIRETSSDVERYHEIRRRLRDTSPEKWFELGRWAQERGEFYKDHELLARSEDAYQRGFEIERKALAKDNPEGLLELVEKAKVYRLASSLREEMAHEAFHLLAGRSRDQPLEALENLQKRMAAQLPGCTEPLSYVPRDLADKYQSHPLETYASAGQIDRRKLHRLLYADLVMRTITRELAADASNGFEIAATIDKLVPEQHILAEGLRDRALAARASEVEKLTKSELIELADQYRARKQPRQAEHLTESWLTLRLRGLDPDDTDGLLELTEEYRRLLGRGDQADRLLIEGWKRNPKATDIIERLQTAGYHLFEGAWLTDAEYNSRPEGQLERAIRAGRVEPGMTPSHVRRSLGEPISQARAVTAGQVAEVWRYNLSDASQLIVRFVKRAAQPELTVADVMQTRAR